MKSTSLRILVIMKVCMLASLDSAGRDNNEYTPEIFQDKIGIVVPVGVPFHVKKEP